MTKKLLALTLVASAVQNGEVVVEITPTDKGFEKQEAAYVKASDYRSELLGAITAGVATTAKAQFVDNEEVQTVTGALGFGGTELSATVYRHFQVEDDSEVIDNHVIVSSVDDFTKVVNDSLAGIFDGDDATEEK